MIMPIITAAVVVAGMIGAPITTAVDPQPVLQASASSGQLIGPAKIISDSGTDSGKAVLFPAPISSDAGFIHPGVFLESSQLDYVKAQLGTDPASDPWAAILTLSNTTKGDGGQVFSSLSYTARPATTIDCGASLTSCLALQDDALAAYIHALKFYYSTASDRYIHANKTIDIINAWSAKARSTNGNQARLETAFAAGTYAQAAEIVRYTYTPASGQPTLNVPALNALFKNVFIPTIQAGDAYSNGNWELSMAFSMINMGVFLDDRAVFGRGLELWRQRVPAYIYLESDGPLPNPVPGGKYDTTAKLNCYWAGAGTPTETCTLPAGFSYHEGMSQETCRDMSHVALGLRAMTHGAETAYLQGVNLYGEQRARIVAAHEFATKYSAEQLTTGKVPSWLCGGKLNGATASGYKLGWEVAYNHFPNRIGTAMPNTYGFIKTYTRPSSYQADQFSGWVTLTHADVEMPANCTIPDRRLGATSLRINVPASNTYRLWTRVKPAADMPSSYGVRLNNDCGIKAGGLGLPANTWNWVDYQDGSSAAKTNLSLAAGDHTLTIAGVTAGLAIDSILLLSDASCVPTGNGSNCVNPPSDTTAPTATLTAPASGAQLAGTVVLSADATDDTAVSEVRFYANDALLGTAATLPYDFSWDTTTVRNGAYQLHVEAYDAAGNSAPSSSVQVTTENVDTKAPTAPTQLVSTNLTSTSVSLQWHAASDNTAVTGYHVYRNEQLVGTVPDLQYTDTGLTSDTTYTYTLKASDAAGNTSAPSNPLAITTLPPPDTTAPTAPVAISAVASSQTSVLVSWEASSDNVRVDSYKVYREGRVIATVNALEYTDINLAANTPYRYTIVATDAAGNDSAESNALTVTISDTTAPGAPTALSITNRTATSVSLAWSAATDNVGVVNYLLYRNGILLATLQELQFTDSTVAPDSSYDFTVKAADAAGNVSVASNAVTVSAQDTTAPTAPTNLTATANTATRITTQWSAASDDRGVEQYQVIRGGTVIATVGAAQLSYIDTTVSASTTYSYAVKAIDAAGNISPASSSLNITTLALKAPYTSGFTAAYFNNTTLRGQPIERIDSTINFNWGSNAPMAGIGADYFSVRWTGQLTPVKSGTYTFYTEVSDGVRLWVNNKLIIDKWSGPSSSLSASYSMSAGRPYDIRMEYLESTGSSYAKLLWSGPGISKAPIPSTVMKSGSSGLSASYFANDSLLGAPTVVRLDNTVNFSWGTGSPDSRLAADNFSTRWTGKIKPSVSGTHTFYTESDDGVRLWVNGQLLINNWTMHTSTVNSRTISLSAGVWYDIRMEHQERTGSAVAKLSWSGPNFSRVTVPATALRDR